MVSIEDNSLVLQTQTQTQKQEQEQEQSSMEQNLEKNLEVKNLDLTQVIDSTLITTDFDGLRFASASALQIIPLLSGIGPLATSNLLITSPYNTPSQNLDLTRISLEYRIFTLALTVLRPIREDYATAPYLESFNWDQVLQLTRRLSDLVGFEWTRKEFYTVIFRSKLNHGIDEDYLTQLDSMSHQEAVISGGLLKYWFGSRDSENRNLATCVWRNSQDAMKGGTGPWHIKARRAGDYLYEDITFTTWKMTISEGAKAISMEEVHRRRA